MNELETTYIENQKSINHSLLEFDIKMFKTDNLTTGK